jgi:hypothetical protein
MKLALAIAVVLAAGTLAYLVVDPLGDGSGSTSSTVGTGATATRARHPGNEPLSGTACQRLAGLAANLASRDRGAEPFLVDLGQQGAGIRPGRLALVDLAHDGRNLILGRGFKAEFDDGTRGQVRHFVGVARASLFGGGPLTRWISEHLRGDPADSADGRLADQGIDFAQALLTGRLEVSEAADWIRQRLCKP